MKEANSIKILSAITSFSVGATQPHKTLMALRVVTNTRGPILPNKTMLKNMIVDISKDKDKRELSILKIFLLL